MYKWYAGQLHLIRYDENSFEFVAYSGFDDLFKFMAFNP